jgi:hypothetical protein
MKQKIFLFSVIAILTLVCTSLSYAWEGVKGRVVEMNNSQIALQVKGESIRRFDITEDTTIYREGKPIRTHHLLPNSEVVVIPERGSAKAIFVKGAPK